MEIKKEDYVARLSSATPVDMVIINYEILLDYIATAKNCVETNRESYTKNLNLARESLMLLMTSLNMNYEISQTLMNLYLHCNQLMINAGMKPSVALLDQVQNILEPVLESWKAIEKTQDAEEPVMENTQKLVAGMTYKDGQLSEFVVEDENRGFKA